jgi:hypothetical protein
MLALSNKMRIALLLTALGSYSMPFAEVKEQNSEQIFRLEG